MAPLVLETTHCFSGPPGLGSVSNAAWVLTHFSLCCKHTQSSTLADLLSSLEHMLLAVIMPSSLYDDDPSLTDG